MQKDENQNIPDVERQGWNVEKLNEESVNEDFDDILRKTLRGNEDEGDSEERDLVGKANSDETPQAKEEAKNEAQNAASKNS
ncbi:MAG: hypothetical protein ACR2L1_04320 [Pyrinomonadaceae bacterium]